MTRHNFSPHVAVLTSLFSLEDIQITKLKLGCGRLDNHRMFLLALRQGLLLFHLFLFNFSHPCEQFRTVLHFQKTYKTQKKKVENNYNLKTGN